MAYRDSNIESVGDYEYSQSDMIGHGAFAIVYKGCHKLKGDPVAIKRISKKKMNRSSSLLEKEISILKSLQHKNIVQLFDCKESSLNVYLVIEYCNGGDLSEYLQAKGTLSEDTIRYFLRQIIEAMKVLNMKGIMHRDLKPQNLLLSHEHPNPKPHEITIKIADFGFARHLQNSVMATTMCGSPMYMAPEVITSELYNAKADLWSIGTIVYQCLVGKAPFLANNPQELRNIYERNKQTTPRIPPGTSRELHELLIGLLKKNVSERLSFQDFFNHSFVTMAMKYASQPVPVPSRRSSHNPSPLSSNNSDPRFVIPLSPPRGTDASSPSIDREVVLAMSLASSPLSSKDSEEFVIVSHPPVASSPESCDKNSATQRNKHHSLARRESEACNSSGRSSPLDRVRASSSPTPPYIQRRITRTPPPLATSPIVRNNQQIFGDRKSSLSGGLGGVRYSSSPKDRRNRSDLNHEPSPSPLPVPTQLENYEKMERKHSLSSCSPASPSNGELIARKHVTSAEEASPLPRPSPISSPLLHSSPQPTQRVRRQSSKNVEFSSIPENPGNESIKTTNERTDNGHGSMSKAQTVPDLVGYRKKEGTIGRCRSSNKLSDQVTRMLFSGQRLDVGPGIMDAIAPLPPHSISRGSLTPPNSPGDGGDLVAYNRRHLLFPRTTAPSLSQQAKQFIAASPPGDRTQYEAGNPHLSSDVDGPLRSQKSSRDSTDPDLEIDVNVLAFYCRLADVIDDVASEHVSALDCELTSLSFMDQSAASKPDHALSLDPLHNVTQEQRQVEQVVLLLRSLQILSAIMRTVKDKVNKDQLHLNVDMKRLIVEVNNRYKATCRSCQLARSKCDEETLKQHQFKSADRLLYYYAVHDCRGSALAEMYEGNIERCIERYRRAVVLLEGLSIGATDMLDKQRLNKYKASIHHRLKHLRSIWSPSADPI